MNNKTKKTTELLEIFESLNEARQQSLFDYASYLHSLGDLQNKKIPEPESIERPETETVVGAIKRLKITYHMVGSMTVFSDASALMTEHMVKGRAVIEVIDEMEILFEDAYQGLLSDQEKQSS